MDDAQEGETPPEDEDAEQEYFSLGEEDHPQVTPGEDHPSTTGMMKKMTLGHHLG